LKIKRSKKVDEEQKPIPEDDKKNENESKEEKISGFLFKTVPGG
jgi:hypothetical protein